MHSACDFNGDTGGSQEQILIHRIDRKNHLNNDNNGHANNTRNSNDELFMSASSTTEFTPQILMSENFIGGNGYSGSVIINQCNKSSTTTPTSLVSPATLPTLPTLPSASMVGGDVLGSIGSMIGSEISASYTPKHQTNLTTTTTASLLPTSKLTIHKQTNNRIEYDDLLQWKDMPKHLQFNPYVLTGYRPLQTIQGCFYSLFYWHNETINILTHGIPIVYILAIVPGLMPWENEFRFLSFCHLFGAVAPWCGSFIYHLFMNVEHGENIYYRLLKIDMLGIWISQSFGALPMVTATVYCFGFTWKWLMIIGYCILSIWGLYKAMSATSPWQRRLCFLLPFTMRVILTFLRTLRLVGGNPMALTHVYLQDLVSVFGGAIGAMHIPEKWWPGSVDFYLNSHNIMHVLVVVAVYSMHKATISDFEWMSTTQCNNAAYNSTETIQTPLSQHIDL